MKIIRIRNRKVKFGKCKDWEKCESQKIKGQKNVWVGQIWKNSEMVITWK